MADDSSAQTREHGLGDKDEITPIVPLSDLPKQFKQDAARTLDEFKPDQFPGKAYNIGHFFGIGVIVSNILAIVAFSIVAGNKERSKGSSAFYFVLFFSAISNLTFIIFEFLQDKSNLAKRMLSNEYYQVLVFDIVFWMSYPSVFFALLIPLVYGFFQILLSVEPICQGFKNIRIPNEVQNSIRSILDKKPRVLDYLAISEPVWLVFLVLSVFWNHIYSIPLYFLWLNLRLKYSKHTQFAFSWWGRLLDTYVQPVSFVNPHYAKVRGVLRKADLTGYLP